MEELPEELVKYILSFLTLYSERKWARCVCKKWLEELRKVPVEEPRLEIGDHLLRGDLEHGPVAFKKCFSPPHGHDNWVTFVLNGKQMMPFGRTLFPFSNDQQHYIGFMGREINMCVAYTTFALHLEVVWRWQLKQIRTNIICHNDRRFLELPLQSWSPEMKTSLLVEYILPMLKELPISKEERRQWEEWIPLFDFNLLKKLEEYFDDPPELVESRVNNQ